MLLGEELPYINGKYTQLQIFDNLSYEKGTIDSSVITSSLNTDIVTKKSIYSMDGIELTQITSNNHYMGSINPQSALTNSFNIGTQNPINTSLEKSNISIKAGEHNSSMTTITRNDDIGKYLSVRYVDGKNGDRNMITTNRLDFSDDLADITLDPSEHTMLANNNQDALISIKNKIDEMQARDNFDSSLKSSEMLPQINKSKYKAGLMKVAEKSGLVQDNPSREN